MGNLSLNGWQLCFSANLEVVHEEIVESLLMLLMILPGALLVIAVGGWWIGGVALAPIENITRIVEEITASGLDRRIPSGETEDEIGRLIRVLNDMIGRLESSFQQAARFSADASHQLKTPLTILQNEVDGALKSGEFSEEQIPVLLHLGEEIQRLKSIVESLLVLSRSDAGNLHLEKERLDYGQLINELVEDTRILGGTQDITVDSHLAESVEVVGDESLLRQAILNLLDNAVRFNQPHGKIRCGLEREGTWAVLTIFNNGPGIQRHHHDHIFERFYRVFGDQQTHPKGFGLGLSLAFEITKAHNGRIELIRSDPDGTEFQLRLPAV